MTWMGRLKNQDKPAGVATNATKGQRVPDLDATNATKPQFVAFVAPTPEHIQKFEGANQTAGNDPEAYPLPANDGPKIGAVESATVRPTSDASNDAEPGGIQHGASAPGADPDRWCWPHSSAMNTAEIDTFTGRLALFTGRGLRLTDAEALADKLVIRDRVGDDRRLCLECANLSGRRCGAWHQSGIGGPSVPIDLLDVLQRCGGVNDSNPHRTTL